MFYSQIGITVLFDESMKNLYLTYPGLLDCFLTGPDDTIMASSQKPRELLLALALTLLLAFIWAFFNEAPQAPSLAQLLVGGAELPHAVAAPRDIFCNKHSISFGASSDIGCNLEHYIDEL